MRARLEASLLPLLALLASCDGRAPLVYVLESPQSVTLTPSASVSSAKSGEEVTLRVERRTSGSWRQVPRDQLKPGQCWLYRPPAEAEEEVAHNVHWEVVPENAVQFATTYQLDRTRIATVRRSGTVKLTPISPVQCEPNRLVKGPSIQIEVS